MKTLALFLLSVTPAFATTLTDDLTGQLYAMRSVYAAEYAPADWKNSQFGYSLDASFQQALAATQGRPGLDIVGARGVLKDFVYAMKDYHVSISFTATEQATLPLVIKGAGDRFFLAYIDRAKLPEASFPFKVGDELVTFAGKPALEAVNAVAAEETPNVTGTDRALAELTLTRRRASRGYAVPRGPVTLGIQRQGSATVTEIQLIWDYVAETIFPRGDLSRFSDAADVVPTARVVKAPMMSVSFDKEAAENPYGIGGRKTFTPALGTKIFETAADDTFHAYIYKHANGKLVGYLRLPSYVPEDYKKAVADFAAIIERFESVTDSMVIDQVDNPGGSIFYLYTLASMLTERPLLNPRHRMAVTQLDVKESLDAIKKLQGVTDDESARKALSDEDLHGYPASYEFVRFALENARFMVSEWEAGRKLTRASWIAGVDHINPAGTHYTKPILLLVNHLDFSGGDFFPSILQDNHRATVMGSRTAGAGGYVVDVKIPNNVGVDSFRVTESIAERAGGEPIENLGVTPDILYEMTAEDYQKNFAPYVKAIQEAVGRL